MNFLGTKLAQLEAQLKTLVEGGFSRFANSRGKLDGLSVGLLAEMQAGGQLDSAGNRFAPDRYTLSVKPEDARILREDPSLLTSLAETIQEAGKGAGLNFPSPPQVKVVSDPGLPKHQVRIQAQIGQDRLSETSTSDVTLVECSTSIPANAFVIVEGVQVFPLTQAVINIGRRLDNHIVLDDARVSRVHAQLRAIRGRYVIFWQEAQKAIEKGEGKVVHFKLTEEQLAEGGLICGGNIDVFVEPLHEGFLDIYREVAEIHQTGGSGILATVISVDGGFPKKEGTKVFFREYGE